MINYVLKSFLLIILLPIVSFSQIRFPSKLSTEEKLYRLGVVYSEVKQNFVNYDRITFSWDSLYKQTITEVLKTDNDWDYYLLLKRMMASLNDGHTEIVADWPFAEYCDYPVVNSSIVGNKYFITWTRESLIDSVVIGSEVMKINGVKAEEYVKTYTLPYISASTEKSRQRGALYATLWNKKDIPYRITFKRRTDGELVTLTLPRNGEAIRNDELDPNVNITISKPWVPAEISWESNSIAVMAINTFNEKHLNANKIDSLVGLVSQSRGLIIDLRRNGGGSTAIAKRLLSYLIKDDYFLTYGWETRINDAVRKAYGYGYDNYKNYYNNIAYRREAPDTIRIDTSIKRLTMPVVILIGHRTYSAAEDFLMMIYEIKERPLIIGEETGGSTGSPLVIPFETGVYARICTRRQFFPYSQKLFVGEGIKPDIEINPTIDDLIMGKDVVIERALMHLNQ